MFVYKFNQFSNKFYKYDTDYVDIFSPMFDEDLHQNDLTPCNFHRTICQYCNTDFESRNKLFYHLKFMNIDTEKKYIVYNNDEVLISYKKSKFLNLKINKKIEKKKYNINRINNLINLFNKIL